MLFRELAGHPAVTIDLVTAAAGAVREEVAFSDNIRLIRLPAGIRDIHHAGARELLTFTFRARREVARLHRARPYDAALAWHAVPAGLPLLPLRWFHKLPFLVRVGRGPTSPDSKNATTASIPSSNPCCARSGRPRPASS
jgi:hypothetical protein